MQDVAHQVQKRLLATAVERIKLNDIARMRQNPFSLCKAKA